MTLLKSSTEIIESTLRQSTPSHRYGLGVLFIFSHDYDFVDGFHSIDGICNWHALGGRYHFAKLLDFAIIKLH